MKTLNLITIFSLSFIVLETSAMSRALVKCTDIALEASSASTSRLLRLLSTQQRGIITATRTSKPKSPTSGLISKRLESSKTKENIKCDMCANDLSTSIVGAAVLGVASGLLGIVFVEEGGPDKVEKALDKWALKRFIQQHPVSDDIRQAINNHQRDLRGYFPTITIGSTCYRIDSISFNDIAHMALIKPMQKVISENNLDKLDVNHMGVIKIKDFPYVSNDLYVVRDSIEESIETRKISLAEIQQLVTFIEKTGFKFDDKHYQIARNHLGKIVIPKANFCDFANKMYLAELLDHNLLEPDAYNWLQQQIKEKDMKKVQSLPDSLGFIRRTSKWAADGVPYSREIAL